MINKRFEELLRINNRQDFESKFLINGDSSCAFLRTKDGDFECECPWIKRCNPKDDCMECWENAIQNSKFNGEY